MNIKLLLFGITSDLLKTSSLHLELEENSSVSDLKTTLVKHYPQLKNIDSYAIAINEEYASEETQINPNDVIAIIPPVSGG